MVIENFNKETTFNEAVLKMQRIHSAQQVINELRTNQLAWNPNYQKYNYEIIISNLVSLSYEVSPLMKPKELEEFYLLRKLVDDLLAHHPIHEDNKSSNFGETSKQKLIKYKNWNILREVMLKFEDFARKQIEVHGLAAPKKKDPRKAAIDL